MLGFNCRGRKQACWLDQRDSGGLDEPDFDQFKSEGHPPGVHSKLSCCNQYGKGNLAVNSRTRCRTSATVSRFLMSIKTSLIMSAMAAISCSFIPRVVTAGVPRRIPLAWKGERVSNGMVFLFTVM